MIFLIEYIYATSCTNGRSPLGLLGVNKMKKSGECRQSVGDKNNTE